MSTGYVSLQGQKKQPMSQVIDALKWRYATKKFNPERILSKDKINVIKEAFDLTATSFGLQPVRLVVLNDKEVQQSLVPLSMDQQQIADASHVLIFCIEKKVDGAFVEAYFENIKTVRQTPDEILHPFRTYLLDLFAKESQDDTKNWATKQAYLAMGNLLTICALEEIDACPMEGFDPAGYDEVLGLADHDLQSVLVMPVGYRAEDDMFSGFKKVRKGSAKTVLEL